MDTRTEEIKALHNITVAMRAQRWSIENAIATSAEEDTLEKLTEALQQQDNERRATIGRLMFYHGLSYSECGDIMSRAEMEGAK
jgi:hypothetical protein